MNSKPKGPLLDSRELEAERSRMSAERTLMAWIRTSLSMIGVGFTIYKFFQYVNVFGSTEGVDPQGAFYLGATLVIMGTFFLVPATFQHIRYLRHLEHETTRRFSLSWAQMAAIATALLGFGAIANLLFRWGPF